MSDEIREQRSFAAELKFLLTHEQADAIHAWALQRLRADPHGTGANQDRYDITSLYCDTAAQDVYFRRRSYGRAKYRVRRYGTSDVAFLERKLRTRDLLSKRRSAVPIGELAWLTPESQTTPQPWAGDWFSQRIQTRRLGPVCQVAYSRIARVTQTPYGLARLTLDTNIRAWPTDEFVFQSGPSTPALTDKVILELKFQVEMPAAFKYLAEEFNLRPDRVSKYRLSMVALELAPSPTSEEATACQTS